MKTKAPSGSPQGGELLRLSKEIVAEEYDGYKIPLYPLLPVIFILFLLFVSYSVIVSNIESAFIGLILFAAGYPIFLLMRKFHPS